MELIRGLYNLRSRHRGCVATIGNYDGVHRGHQAVLAGLREHACELDLPAVVVVFEPTPREYFASTKAPARLSRFREKWVALRACGIDRVLCLRFDRRLAQMPPEEFIQRVLLDGLAVRYLVVGDDFRFGRERAGDFTLLQRAAGEYGFELDRTSTLAASGERVSSTRVRRALAEGDLDSAAALLGHPFALRGRVRHGEGLGRRLGYPTINILLERGRTPVHGIFVVAVRGIGKQALDGVASVGTRPTVNGRQTLLEVFILDFKGNLYGCHLEVEFIARLRDEMRFDSLDELKDNMAADVKQARAYIAQRSSQ